MLFLVLAGIQKSSLVCCPARSKAKLNFPDMLVSDEVIAPVHATPPPTAVHTSLPADDTLLRDESSGELLMFESFRANTLAAQPQTGCC